MVDAKAQGISFLKVSMFFQGLAVRIVGLPLEHLLRARRKTIS